MSLLSIKLRSIVIPEEVVVRNGGSNGISAFGNNVPSILGMLFAVPALISLPELAGREDMGRAGGLFSSSIVNSKILKLFPLRVLLPLFFDETETLSLSSRCFLARAIPSESLPPLSYETALLALSSRLATRGIGGSKGGARPAVLFFLFAMPSLVLGRRDSIEGFEETDMGDRSGASKSKVICNGLTSGASLTGAGLESVLVVGVEKFRPCDGAYGMAGGGADGGAGGGGACMGCGGGLLRFFLNIMAAIRGGDPHAYVRSSLE